MRKTFGIPIDVERIEYEMNVKGMNLAMLAEKCGWLRCQLAKIMQNGRCRPYTLEIIATALDLPITELMVDELSTIKVMLDEGAKMPTRAHDGDAGLDFYSRERTHIIPGRSYEFDTGVHIQIPKGYVGDVESKSGLMMEYDILTDGTVDYGYTGAVRVKLFNHGKDTVHIQNGQKIAQLVIKKIITPEPVLADSLEETERGSNGFGSSGKF